MSMVGTGYAELHCHTNFSFLDGASHPEELAEEAHRLGLTGLAVTDHDGLYGVVRFAEAARPLGLPTVFGAELTLGLDRRAGGNGAGGASRGASATSGTERRAGGNGAGGGSRGAGATSGTERRAGGNGAGGASRGASATSGLAEVPGEHVLILAEGPAGYAALARTISEAQLRGEKGAPRLALARPRGRDDCRRAVVHDHRVSQGHRAGGAGARRPAAAQHALEQLIALRSRPRARRAVGPRRPARPAPQRRARAARGADRRRGGRHQQRALRHPGPSPARDRARGDPVAPRRSTSSTAGCRPPRSRTCAARPSSCAGSPAGRARSSAPSTSRPRARSTSSSRRRTCPTIRCPTATPR